MHKKDSKSRDQLLDYLDDKAEWLRREIIRLSSIAGGAHLGGGLSMADVIVAVYYYAMNLKQGDPTWADRDRFILSKGHGAVAYCPVLADQGFFSPDWLNTFNNLDSPFGMHPDMKKIPGCDMSTGSLGHGLSVAVGMALTARLDKKSWRVFVLMGDGEINEGMVWEAAPAASHFKLGNIVAIIDRNTLSLDGPTEEIMAIEPIAKRWEAFGWRVFDIDGHDMGALVDTLDKLPPSSDPTPTLIVARTVKGKGVDFMENNPIWHYAGLDKAKSAEALTCIGNCRPKRRT
ncbi:MAG: transketolase [Deltaproteobacteria bacterium]|nr:transketolase [Candidatus Zymogenaceae bacterium]